MDWISGLFTEHTFIQAILILSLISAVGLAFGSIRIFGVSLGVTCVFFTGIIAGHFGIDINPEMLELSQNFGLIIFIYSLGVQVGPGFFSAFKKGGVKLNILAIMLLVTGTLTMCAAYWITDISIADAVGLFAGAVTNTPMLGAAQQALAQINPADTDSINSMAMACAIGYPVGLISMILCVAIMRRTYPANIFSKRRADASDSTFIAEYMVSNPDIFGKSIHEIRLGTDSQFVISRIWKDGKVIIPTSETTIEKGEHILVISDKKDVESIRKIFGHRQNVDWNKKDIDWNAIDNQLVSRKILVTKPELNGVKLGSLRLRNSFGINITRINRAGMDLLPSKSLRLQLGDKVTIVGEARSIENAGKILGNEAKQLRTPNLPAIFIGIIAGLVLGSIPLAIPGIGMPIKLGIAGGPIIIGILMGAFGPRLHLSTYMSQSANLMLRQLGLTIYLAGLGLSAGAGFFETVLTNEGLTWVIVSAILAIVPVLITGLTAARLFKTDYAQTIGMLCGGMANPIALNYANSITKSDEPSAAYATVYPLSIFLRVISAQIIIMIFV
ncbi:MAG: putative transporter [Bacteroidales bacterium]|nr:putative transporter [Bacteroidales bacterium]